jgi:MYXO-CTERM domain-containing protein
MNDAGDAVDGAGSNSSGCSCATTGTPANGLGLAGPVLGVAMLLARRRTRR